MGWRAEVIRAEDPDALIAAHGTALRGTFAGLGYFKKSDPRSLRFFARLLNWADKQQRIADIYRHRRTACMGSETGGGEGDRGTCGFAKISFPDKITEVGT